MPIVIAVSYGLVLDRVATGTPARHTSGPRTDDRHPRAPANYPPRQPPGAGGALARRAAHEIKLVGDVDQLTRSQLPTAHGQPVG